jgi:hypothetical protein
VEDALFVEPDAGLRDAAEKPRQAMQEAREERRPHALAPTEDHVDRELLEGVELAFEPVGHAARTMGVSNRKKARARQDARGNRI